LAHLRGSENLLVDMLEDPESVKKALENIQAAWFKTIDNVYDITKKSNEGASSIGWMISWAPGKHAQLQCDLSVMISPELFDVFILLEFKEQSAFLDYCTYHLDGIEQKRHMDKILAIPQIGMIQWTCVEGQPSAMDELESLKKIQAAGKALLILVKPQEVKPLLQNLSSKGLYLVVLGAASNEETDDIVKCVQLFTHD
jgi:hypothetical protein